MTPQTRAELEQKLAEHGLTVLLTRDYNTILLHLARLAQFERLLLTAAKTDPLCQHALDLIQAHWLPYNDDCPDTLGILDIPEILMAINRVLNSLSDRQARINTDRLPAAIAAFAGILCAQGE